MGKHKTRTLCPNSCFENCNVALLGKLNSSSTGMSKTGKTEFKLLNPHSLSMPPKPPGSIHSPKVGDQKVLRELNHDPRGA